MSKSLIFITGATGFIGSHVVFEALKGGYQVRLSVRRASQIQGLQKLFSEFAAKVEFVVIPDLGAPEAFNQALQGVSYVFHLASPMPGKGTDFEKDYLTPAVQGTILLLNTAKSMPTIKRIVIVSSFLALVPLGALSTNYRAKEGSNASIPIDSGMKFTGANARQEYQASKILAHRATLEWTAKEKPHFNVITLHPAFVFGRNLTQTSSDALDGTNAMLWASLHSEKPSIPMSAVDVRDVASAHVKALQTIFETTAQVEEFLLSASEADGWTWGGVASFVRERYPTLKIKLNGKFNAPPVIETERAEKLLGLQWRKMEDTISSFLDHQLELRHRL